MGNLITLSNWQKNVGIWRGRQQVFQTPDKLSAEGELELELQARMGGRALELAYSYSLDGKDYQGILLVSKTSEQAVEASWVDGYHTNWGFMKFGGTERRSALVLEGGYHYGENFWGWTIEISSEGDSLKVQHFNRPPDGERYLGVDISLERSG